MSGEPQCTIDFNGTKQWLLKGKLHRTDGPAVEAANGTKEWYFNGNLHRSDGPALEEADGTKEWYFNGKRHRTDGPAAEWANGDKEWYFNDEWLGFGDEGFWALWEKQTEEERSNWKLLQWAPWVKR